MAELMVLHNAELVVIIKLLSRETKTKIGGMYYE